jgi:hypothetical protein
MIRKRIVANLELMNFFKIKGQYCLILFKKEEVLTMLISISWSKTYINTITVTDRHETQPS